MGKTADELNSYDPLDETKRDTYIAPTAARMDDDDDDDDDDDEVIVEVEEIRADIEQTRGEMTDTINGIQERPRWKHRMEKAKATVKSATIGTV